MTKPNYTAVATSWGGRDGRVVTDDNKIDLNLSVPAGMGGDDGSGTNPEQLFASGWAACFHGALKAVGGGHGVDLKDSAVTLTVNLLGEFKTGLYFEVTIAAQMPGIDDETGHKLLAEAHEFCPYSRVTRGNAKVELLLVTDED